MFSTEHFIWIVLCALFVVLLTFISKKKDFSLKTAGYIITGISAVSEICKMMTNMEESSKGGSFLDPSDLPLHLCSLLLFAVLFITFGEDGRLKQLIINFTAVAGAVGSVCAILIPTNGTDFGDILAYQCFVYHAGLLWFAVYLIVTKKAELGLKAYTKNLLLMLALVLFTLYANSVLSVYDTNFMYLVRPPMKNLPFLTLDFGWYVYFLHLLSLGILVITLFHLPFIITDIKNKK